MVEFWWSFTQLKGGDWGVGVGLDYIETNAFSQGGFRGGGYPFPLFDVPKQSKAKQVSSRC